MFFPFHDDNPTVRTPVVTYVLVAVNVLVFLLTVGFSTRDQQLLAYQHGFVPARIGQLVRAQPIAVPVRALAVDPLGQQVVVERRLELPPARGSILLSLLTCMFLHGGWFHLLGNMWFLWIFGNNVEDRLGRVAYLLFYLGGGLVASGSHWLVDPTSTVPVIGASGAVATILGAYAVTWPWARVRTLVFLLIFVTVMDIPALLVLGVWFLGQILAGAQQFHQIGGVAWWAHIGGFVTGYLLMPLLDRALNGQPPPRPLPGWQDDPYA